MNYGEISSGLKVLVRDGRRHPDIILRKINEMQRIYLKRSIDLYHENDLKLIDYFLRTLAFKFHLANLSLEQLWSLSHETRMQIIDALRNSTDRLDVSEDDLLAISFVFEGFLFQARSFLDFYMLYICAVLRTGHTGSMSSKRFYKELDKSLEEPFNQKASTIREYFQMNVFGEPKPGSISPKNWGSLLTSMRDKIAHRDILRPSFDSDELLIGDILFNWPTIQDETYNRFCQLMQNGMFYLFHDSAPILFDLEWKSGPFQPRLWD